MKSKISFFAITALLIAPACTPSTNPHFKVGNPYTIEGKKYYPAVNPKYAEIGKASWYGNGDGFHNQLTANGELFDRDEMTAAHKTLPLPSIVNVTNLGNGKTVQLRVNDRGPFVAGRIIDVSEKAAKKLGFRDSGVAKVLVELDKEKSLNAIENISVSQDNYNLIKKAYGEAAVASVKIVEPVAVASVSNESSSNDLKIISTALNQENQKNMPASMVKPSLSTDQIVIRDEIVKPASSTASLIKTSSYSAPSYKAHSYKSSSYKTPKSMNNATSRIIDSSTGVEKGFYVQVASLNDISKASEISRDVRRFSENKVMDAIVNGKQYYRVRLGAFATKSEAQVALSNIRRDGFADAFIVSEN